MRSLLMLRHAKSDWNADYGDDDRLRPLAPRGRRAAATMGRFLAVVGQVPDRALTSPAVRARDTLELAMHAGALSCDVEVCDDLYGDVTAVMSAIRARGGDAETLLIVGHEPSWTAAASQLAGGARFRLPTAALLRLDIDIDTWSNVNGGAIVQWLMTPRLLRKTLPSGRAGGERGPLRLKNRTP